MDRELDLEHSQKEFLRVASSTGSERDRKALTEQLLNLQAHRGEWKDANNIQAMRGALENLERDLHTVAREGRGSWQPDATLPLSDFSGRRANAPLSSPATRRDALGRMPMPAENLEALGRSLFTDYLVPVELAGTLLLVATIGAIAIAGRREGLR
jgi:hypothetical protein